MDLQAIAFYLLAAVTVISGFLVITARNPVHSVLFLIMAFFTAAGLFVMLGAEFLAMLLIVVYVGAVAVLFNQRFQKSKKAATSNWANVRLSEAQLIYAANDAYAALRVFESLSREAIA